MHSAPPSCRQTETILSSAPPFLKDNHDQSFPPKFVTLPSKKTICRRRSSSSSNTTTDTSTNSTTEDGAYDHYDGQSSCCDRGRGRDRRTKTRNSKLWKRLPFTDSVAKSSKSPSSHHRKHSTSENLLPPPKSPWRFTFSRKATKHPTKRKRKTQIFEDVSDQYDVDGVLQRTTVVWTKHPDGTTSSWKHKDFISPTNPKYPRKKTTTKNKSVRKAPQRITQKDNGQYNENEDIQQMAINCSKNSKERALPPNHPKHHKKKSIESHHPKNNRKHVPSLK